ncbi:MAG: hypothetical protein ACWA5L_02700 [bacterium]
MKNYFEKTKQILFPLFLFSTALSPALQAEEAKIKPINLINEEENEDLFSFSYGAPSSPALALSGLTSEDLTRVNEYKKFSFYIVPADDADIPLAYALDLRPSQFIHPTGNRLRRSFSGTLHENYAERVLRNSSIGLVLRKGVEDTQDSSNNRKSLLTIGAATSLLPGSDPAYQINKLGKDSDCGTDLLDNFSAYHAQDFQKPEREEAYGYWRQADSLLNLPLPSDKDFAWSRLDTAYIKLVEVWQKLIDLGEPHDEIEKVDRQKTIEENATLLRQERDRLEESVKKIDQNVSSVALNKQITACRAIIDSAIKFAPNMDVGIGYILRGEDHTAGNFSDAGYSFWASYRRPILFTKNKIKLQEGTEQQPESWIVFGGKIRLGFDEYVKIDDSITPETQADTMEAAIAGEYFSKDFRITAQYGYSETKIVDSNFQNFSKEGQVWQVGADVKVHDKIWLKSTYGTAYGTTENLEGEILNVSMAFDEPAFANLFFK